MPAPSHLPNSATRRPPQYSLRALFWLTAGLSAVFAVMTTVGFVWSLLLLFLLALVVAHVLGNAIGTRLRDNDTQRSEQALPPGVKPAGRGMAVPTRGPTEMRERRPLGLAMLVFVVAGAVGGALTGRALLVYTQWPPLSAGDAVVGTASCAVLGAMAGFLGSSFFKVAVWPAVKFFFRRK